MRYSNMYIHSELTHRIINCANEVHKLLGQGLLESAYQEALRYELEKSGHRVVLEKSIQIPYKGITIDKSYRIDMVVDNKVLLELKSITSIEKIHEAQVLTYLIFSKIQVGLLINFNVLLLKNGIRRFIYSNK